MMTSITTTPQAPQQPFFNFGFSDSTSVRNPEPGKIETMGNLTAFLSPTNEIVGGKVSSQVLLVEASGQSWDELSTAGHDFDAAELASQPLRSLGVAVAKAGIAELSVRRATNEIGDTTTTVSWGTTHTAKRQTAAPADLPADVRGAYEAALALTDKFAG